MIQLFIGIFKSRQRQENFRHTYMMSESDSDKQFNKLTG